MKKPKHIFLVHGEPEAQEILKDKIQEATNISVSIPAFGETYVIEDEKIDVIENTNMIKEQGEKYIRLQILERLETLKDEIVDMEQIVKEDLHNDTIQDQEIEGLNEKIKELERQIVKIIEN